MAGTVRLERLQQRPDGSLHIEGYPDAVKLVRLRGHTARQIAHYKLHRGDLEVALNSLELINQTENSDLRQILWRSAVINYCKCFGRSQGRSTVLRENKIYKDLLAREAFNYFDNLRNKHFVHDENSLLTSIPCAAVNGGGKPTKIERIFAISFLGETLEQPNYANLHNLISEALVWVKQKFEDLCNDITSELEKESLENLLGREEVRYTVPTLDKISSTRDSI